MGTTNKQNTPKGRKLDLLNLFYGLGAAIILIAAMFKFVGFDHAETVFIVGIGVEVVVFIVSGFSWKQETQNYQWENLFPQLIQNKQEKKNENLETVLGQQQLNHSLQSIETMNHSMTELSLATKEMVAAIKDMKVQYAEVSNASEAYKAELKLLKDRIAYTNKKLSDFEKYDINL